MDTDPGEGSGTALTAQDGAFDSEVEAIAPVDLNVTGLAVGPHLIGIRYKDDNNTWGDVLYQTIHVYDANPSGSGSGGSTDRVWPPADGTVGTGTLGQTSTWTVSGASYGNGTYTAVSSISLFGGNTYKAFDGTHDQGSWHSTAGIKTGILSLELPESFVLTKYELYRRVSNQGPNNDNSLVPQNWTLEGSNDGTNWTVLDTQINQTFTSGVQGEASKKSYSISNNSTSYNHYRINVTANSGGNYLIVGELKLYGTSPTNASVGFAMITGAEYFVDTDPGEGSGTAFEPQDGAFDSEVESIVPKDLNVSGLSVGPHLVGVRYKDNNNTWGEVLYQTIHVYDANPSGSGSGGSGGGGSGGASGGFASISAAEYFVDSDPGAGSGIAFQAKDGAFDSEVESIVPKDLNVTGLSVGPHLVGVRYKDNNNTWGDVLYQTIHVYDANPDINNGGSGGSGGSGGFTVIAGAEYFIGNDPGEGNATALQPKDGAFDSEVESTLTANLSLNGYALGTYLVGVRYMDNNGTWGDVLFKTVEVDVDTDGDGLADKAEAYYETNSTRADTDGDGYSDGEEVAFGSDPTDPSSLGNQAPRDLNSTAVLSFQENQPIGTVIGEFNATDPDGHTITYSLGHQFPSDLSPSLWLDASDLTEAGAVWPDRSSAGKDATKVGSPILDEHSPSGLQVMRYSGSGQYHQFDEITDIRTVFWVLSEDSDATGFGFLLGTTDPNAGGIWHDDGNGNFFSSSYGDPKVYNGATRLNGVSINGRSTQKPHQLSIVSHVTTGNVNATNFSKDRGWNRFWKGNLGELLIFNQVLSAADIASVEQYLGAKWKISVAGASSSSNGLFSLDTNGTLKTATTFDYESNASTYTITVQAKDELNATTEGNFTVTLLDVNEPPTDLNSTTLLTIAENQPISTIVGEFNATDPEGGGIAYSLVDGMAANSYFNLEVNGTLKTARELDYEVSSKYTLFVRATDELNASVEGKFTVMVTGVNEPPMVRSSLHLNINESTDDTIIPAAWDRTFGGTGEEIPKTVIKTADGGYLVAGSSESNTSGEKSEDSRGGMDYWIVKLDELGNKQWDKTLGGSGEDMCQGAVEVSGGGYLVYGGSNSSAEGDRTVGGKGSEDVWVVRVDADGDKLWDKAYGGEGNENCSDVIACKGGGFILGARTGDISGGDISGEPKGDHDFWVLKIDANGNKIWDKRYGGSGWDGLARILETTDGGYLLGGHSQSNISGDKSENAFGKADFWVIKIDADGTKVWDKTLGGTEDEWLSALAPAEDGGFLVTGSSESNATGNKSENSLGYFDFWAVRIDENGNKIWDRTIGANGSESNKDTIRSDDGGHVLLGRGDKDDFWAIKINEDGDRVWDKIYGGEGSYSGESIVANSAGGFVLAGKSWSWSNDKLEANRGNYDYWVINADESGKRNHYANDPEGKTLTWSISGGADAHLFEINATTGQIIFAGGDYEDPQDSDQNNTYEATIRATDPSGLFSEQSMHLVVEDVYEPSLDNHTVELNATVGLEMIWVEPGTFTMGSPTTEVGRDEDEPEHNVTLTQGFYLGKYEVTQAQYEAVMAGNAEGLASNPVSPQFEDSNKPVVQLNYADVQVFLKYLNTKQKSVVANGWEFTLPTEAQWEYACRAGTKTAYSWGDELSPAQANYNWDGDWDTGNDYRLRTVGNYAPNRWGFFDMHGNVSEWIRGWYRTYSEGNITDPEFADIDAEHYVRGGDWYDDKLRSANRGTYVTGDGDKNPFVGFRLALRKKEPSKLISTKAEGLSVSTSDSIGTALTQFESTDLGRVSYTYSLVEGDGGIHNQFFTIDESGVLRTAKEFDYEADQLRQKIRVRATDTVGNQVEAVLTVVLVPGDSAGTVNLTVDPQTIRKIRGVSELRREAYFSICDAGSKLDQRVKSQERYDYLFKELGITPGRRLGVVQPLIRWDEAVREDAARSGYTDIEYLKKVLSEKGVPEEPGSQFVLDMGGRLDIAAHGHKSAFPEFMGKSFTDYSGEDDYYPTNIDAAAELSANALKWKYNDFDRPAYYEPVNEPHWSFWTQPLFQQWHTRTHQAVQAMGLNVAVGGPCLSVAYYYKSQYGAFDGLKSFIDGTNAELDFYSFHAYDFLSRGNGGFDGGEDPSDPGRITSGMPLESVLDLVSNYTTNQYGKEVDVVLSEHGAYGTVELAEELANKHFPGEGFEWEMKKRSIIDFNMVSGVIANTMVFMDHPHVVKKATPFILMESMGWDPEYYATLYVPRNFTDKNDWVETKQIYFYKLMKDVRGDRIESHSPDPDIQMQAFVDAGKVYVLLNNLSNRSHGLNLSIPSPISKTCRRVGRNADFTPYFVEEDAGDLSAMQIEGRESIVLVLGYENLEVAKEINEVPYYGDSIRVPVEGTSEITVSVPDLKLIEYAELRVGISKESGTGRAVNISLNGNELNVPYEDAAIRLDNGQDYATSKIIRVPANYVQNENKVVVSFPGEGVGAVGSVVLRVAYRKNEEPNELILSSNTILENQPIGTIVGEFNATDPEGGAITYHLVNGDNNNSLFTLETNGTLETATVFDYETNASTYTITVQAKDELNATTVKNFTVHLLNDVEDIDGDEIEDFYDDDIDGDGFSNQTELAEGTDPRDPYSSPMLPILKTISGYLDENGSIILRGQVEANGEAKISDFGFVLSPSISLRRNNAEDIWIRGEGRPTQFTLKVEKSPFEGDLYFRAWAKNAAGYGVGPVKKVIFAEEPSAWWGTTEELSSGWKNSSWLGIFRAYDGGWLYHARLGWLFSREAPEQSVWLWKEKDGWLWTKSELWPYLWSQNTADWLYLLPGKAGEPSKFYDFTIEAYR